MIEISIDNTGDSTSWLYGSEQLWKDYIGCDNFDDQVVLIGNREFTGYTEAEWYNKAKEVLDDIDSYDEYPEYLSDEINNEIKNLYDKCRCTEDILVDVLRLLYPGETFSSGTIRGYSQSNWQDYIIKGNVDIELLEAYYFGKISEICITHNDDSFHDVITHDELWKAEKEDLKEYFRKKYEFSETEEIHIFQADGYTQVLNWKQIA